VLEGYLGSLNVIADVNVIEDCAVVDGPKLKAHVLDVIVCGNVLQRRGR